MAAIATASVNDEAMAGSLVANMRSDGMRAGRVDYAGAGFGTTITQVNKLRKELRETGRISEQSILSASEAIHDDVYASQGGYSLVNAGLKPDAVKEMAPTIIRHAEQAMQSGDDRAFKQSLASMKGTYENLQSSSPNKAKIMADQVFSTRVVVGDLSPGIRQSIQRTGTDHDSDVLTYQQLMTAIAGDPEFREMHREWGNEVEYQMTEGAQQSSQQGGQDGGPPGPQGG
jgi:hypothetical protein